MTALEVLARTFARCLASIDEAWRVVDEVTALLDDPHSHDAPVSDRSLFADQLTLEAP